MTDMTHLQVGQGKVPCTAELSKQKNLKYYRANALENKNSSDLLSYSCLITAAFNWEK